MRHLKNNIIILLLFFLAIFNNMNTYVHSSGDAKLLFSFVQISDTQYAQSSQINSVIDFILENKTQHAIKYVIHTGDIVWQWDNKTSWEIMNASFSRLNGKISFGWLAGNHDYDNKTAYRGIDYFAFNPDNWNLTSSLNDGKNTAQHLHINGKDFLFINIEFYATEYVFEWFNDLYYQYSNATVILSTHSYLYPDSKKYTYDTINATYLSNYPRVKLVLSGHMNFAYNQQISNRQEIVFDRQLRDNFSDQSDYIRIYSFYEGNFINVQTYSNLRKDFLTDNFNHFTFPLGDPPAVSNLLITSYTDKSLFFSALWSDNQSLKGGGYIFSTNITGNWLNASWIAFESDPCFVSVFLTLDNTLEQVIGFREFANNSLNLWGESELLTITTPCDSPFPTAAPTIHSTPDSFSTAKPPPSKETAYSIGIILILSFVVIFSVATAALVYRKRIKI